MATGIDDQLREEKITTGRRETPMTITTALLMKEEDVMTVTTVTDRGCIDKTLRQIISLKLKF